MDGMIKELRDLLADNGDLGLIKEIISDTGDIYLIISEDYEETDILLYFKEKYPQYNFQPSAKGIWVSQKPKKARKPTKDPIKPKKKDEKVVELEDPFGDEDDADVFETDDEMEAFSLEDPSSDGGGDPFKIDEDNPKASDDEGADIFTIDEPHAPPTPKPLPPQNNPLDDIDPFSLEESDETDDDFSTDGSKETSKTIPQPKSPSPKKTAPSSKAKKEPILPEIDSSDINIETLIEEAEGEQDFLEVIEAIIQQTPLFFHTFAKEGTEKDLHDIDPLFSLSHLYFARIKDLSNAEKLRDKYTRISSMRVIKKALKKGHIHRVKLAQIGQIRYEESDIILKPSEYRYYRAFLQTPLLPESEDLFDSKLVDGKQKWVFIQKRRVDKVTLYVNTRKCGLNQPFDKNLGEYIENMIQNRSKIVRPVQVSTDLEDAMQSEIEPSLEYDFPNQWLNNPNRPLRRYFKDIFAFMSNIVSRICRSCGYSFPNDDKIHPTDLLKEYSLIGDIVTEYNHRFVDDDSDKMSYFSPKNEEDHKILLMVLKRDIPQYLANPEEWLSRNNTKFAPTIPHLDNIYMKQFIEDSPSLEGYAKTTKQWLSRVVCPKCKKPMTDTPLLNVWQIVYLILKSIRRGRAVIVYGNGGDGKSQIVRKLMDWFKWKYKTPYNIYPVTEQTSTLALMGGRNPSSIGNSSPDISRNEFGIITRSLLPPNYINDVGQIEKNTAANVIIEELNRSEQKSYSFLMQFLESPYIMTIPPNDLLFRNPNRKVSGEIHWILAATANVSDIGNETLSAPLKSRFDFWENVYPQADMLYAISHILFGLSAGEKEIFDIVYTQTHSWATSGDTNFPAGIRHYRELFSALRETFEDILFGVFEEIPSAQIIALIQESVQYSAGTSDLTQEQIAAFYLQIEFIIKAKIVMALADENNQALRNKVLEEALSTFRPMILKNILTDHQRGKYPYMVHD